MSPDEFQALAKSWKELQTHLNLGIYLKGVKQCSIRVQISGHVKIAGDDYFSVGDEQNTMQINLKGCKFDYLHPEEKLPDFVNPLRIECPFGEVCLILIDQSIN